MENMGIAWVVVMVASLIIEGLTMGLVTMWFAFGALAAFITYSFGASLMVQIIVFLIVSIVLLIFTRPIAKKYLKIGKTKTNVESLIGEKAKVTSKINNLNYQGKAVIKGQEWTARSSYDNIEIEKDEIVCIKKIEGVKLIVEKLSN
ncbi:NfeD family protein [Sedimentibacter sp. zth1]|uniref:NfeD family protein n=1 Tax=Sedimentibacter sp. zth1 TaxID=2816908 RepID=UPI001A90FA81|nr:NfeD family protein [Sedimentibacter sp. zth1]QSX05064.1 NfeD family protein [Sedimentibacter sp. zth1]